MTNRFMTRKAAIFVGLPLFIAGCEASEPLAEQPPTELSAEDTFEGDVEELAEEPLFRAIGQEPGWILRIYRDEIVYEADYGQRTVTVPAPESTPTELGRTYTTDNLTVIIENEDCLDVMSGARYSSRVTVLEDDTRVDGCGGRQLGAPDEGV